MTGKHDSTPSLIYLAGPISSDPLRHTYQAIKLAAELAKMGWLIHVPHVSVLAEMFAPLPYESWMHLDMRGVRRCDALIRRCDALIRLPGESPDADRELELARDLGLPVVRTVPNGWTMIIADIDEALTGLGLTRSKRP